MCASSIFFFENDRAQSVHLNCLLFAYLIIESCSNTEADVTLIKIQNY